jgi:hypothetical protein
VRILSVLPVVLLWYPVYAQDAVEAASACIVVHEEANSEGEKHSTCFENISLERSSFESGVCQWKTDAQDAKQTKVITHFVPSCPVSYSAYCDRLVLGPAIIAPVKIFLYDKSSDVLQRAKKQCLSGGGNWTVNDSAAEAKTEAAAG